MILKFTKQETLTRYTSYEIEVDADMVKTFEEEGDIKTLDDFIHFIDWNYEPINEYDYGHEDVKLSELYHYGCEEEDVEGNIQLVFDHLNGRNKEIHNI